MKLGSLGTQEVSVTSLLVASIGSGALHCGFQVFALA